MATKNILLRKKLLRESILFTVLLIVLCAGGFLLANYADDTQSEKHAKETENNSVRSEHDSIQQQLGMGVELDNFYKSYIKNHNEDFALNRETAARLMGKLREKNHLTNLAITISPVSDAGTDIIAPKSGVLTKSEVHLTFGAMTDSSIYAFIESLQRGLAGMIAVHELKLNRSGDLSNAAILDLSHHKITSLVTGELTFQWLGLRPSEPKTPPSKGAP